MKKILLFSVVLSAILSCHKSSEHIWEDDMAEALLRIQYGCTSTPDNIFFRALIGGEDFCMSTDQPVSGASPQLVFQFTPKHPSDPIK